MQAYEFYTKPKDGALPIPEEYRQLITDNVMVIVLEKKPSKLNNNTAYGVRKTNLLSPPVLETKGFKFNREEANER